MNHYFVVYENIQLFEKKNKIAKLQRIVNEFELCKTDINRFEKLILKIKLTDVVKSKQSAKLFSTLLNFFITSMKVKLTDMNKSKQSTKSFSTLLNFFFIFKKIRKVKLTAVNKSKTSKTKTSTLLSRFKKKITTTNDTKSKNEKTKNFVDGEAVAFSSIANSKKKTTVIKTMSKKIKIEIKTNKNFLLITIEQNHLRTILSFFDFEFQISFDKNLFYTDAMIRNLTSLFSTTTVELYDVFNRQTFIKKLKKKYAQFKNKYDLNLKSVEKKKRFIFSKHLYTLFQSNFNRFQTLTNKFETRKTKDAETIMIRKNPKNKNDKKSAIKRISKKKSKKTNAN